MAVSAPLLPCGRDPLAVVDHAEAGLLDEHERTCPYCGETIDAARLSARLGVDLAAEADTAEPSRDLVSGVMRTVRTELRRAREIPVPSPHGAAFVTDHVVATALRDALDAAGDVVVTSCRVEVLPDHGLAVRVDVHGHWPDDLAAAAGRARDTVLEVLRRDFDLDAPAGVDFTVVDLMESPW